MNKAISCGVDYIELRVDVIDNVTSEKVTDIIKKIKEITTTPIILTNRTKKEGGYFKGTEEERINILKNNAPLVEITDIELSTEESLREKVTHCANKTIISYHNFTKTPTKEFLDKIVKDAYCVGDIPKVALKPENIEDTYILLQLIMENKNMIGISMDKIGTYTRIIGPILGSPITYASIEESSAPGQLDVKTTLEMIRKLKY